MPRSPPGPNKLPVAATRTTSLLRGSSTIRLMNREVLSPMFVHVLPPSVDLYTPSPQLVLCRLFDSPVPTHTRSGLFCEMAMSPMDISPRSCICASNVVPLFTVFHT